MSVARSYARALFETAQAQGVSAVDLSGIEAQLQSWIEVLGSSRDARVALTSPATTSREKLHLTQQIASKIGSTPLVVKFVELLAQKERFDILAELKDAFGTVRLEGEGGVLGRLVSADAMEATDIESLSKAFSQKFGKKVAFTTSVDPTLLAGVKVTVGGVTYDGTMKSQLQRLRDQLVHGAGSVQ